MKVLIVANSPGGLYQFRRELMGELVKQYEVTVLVPQGDFFEEIGALGCKVKRMEMDRHGTNPLSELKLISEYKKEIRAAAPDIVLTYTIKPNIYAGMACASLGVPYVANITGLGTAIENPGLMQKVTVTLYRYGLRKAQKVFFQNAANKDFMVKNHVVRGEYQVIPGSGVNLEKHVFEPYPSEAEGIRFLFVGRIMRDKGINELLEAMDKVHAKHPDTTLDIVGGLDGNYGDVMKQAESRGYIRYHGKQRDVHPYYMNAHCTVLPSYHEGTANVLLESASTGRPVIATRVPGCGETYEDGVTGLGCDVKSAESLAAAMEKFLGQSEAEHAQMGKLGREKMEKEYDRGIVIRAYLDEIRKAKK